MKIKIPSFKSTEYVSVFLITERRGGKVYKTIHYGYARADRERRSDEIYAPLSTSLTRQPEIELELLED